MLNKRVIPTLLFSQGGLVKSKKFKNNKYIGDPTNAIKILNEKEVDELIVIDIDATKESREPNYTFIREIASECFMPLCYGGGVTTIEQARKIFRLGVEKIAIQSSAINDIEIIRQISREFGSQSVVFSLDLQKNIFSKYRVRSGGKKVKVKGGWQNLLREVQEAGAGEVLLNSVDHDGVMEGMNLPLIKEASELLDVPLIAAGGVGSLSDIKDGVISGASAISVGSFFVFNGPHKAVLITYPDYDKLVNLLKGV